MKHRIVAEGGRERTFAIVLDPGDEAVAKINEFARALGIRGAALTAVGAFSSAKLGWLDPERKEHREIAVDEQCEVLSLVGNIARDDRRGGAAIAHAHAVLGLKNGETRGGHLFSGVVRPTLEIILVETPVHLHRTMRPELGMALIDLSGAGDGGGPYGAGSSATRWSRGDD
jgi:predicted DNA-binding protein with PD1-like motif